MISVVIRTLNEVKSLDRLLKILSYQSIKHEVIVVDSGSTDGTIEIAKKYNTILTTCIPFTYGKALNVGINISKYNHICFLSAHCFPINDNYLRTLFLNFKDDTVAGVYSKQLPIEESNFVDKRNLYAIFRDEKISQTKDPFFNNASSMIRKDLWEKYKFDESIEAWEDIKWAKQVQSKGHKIIYEPDTAVHHYHIEDPSKTLDRYKKEYDALEKIYNE